MKLHLGCGNKIIKDFINVDIRPLDGVDVIDDISKLKTIKDNSVELIYACHVLEHFNRLNYKKVLQRWYEILDKNGVLRLSVPDLEKVIKKYNEGEKLHNLMGFIYGGQNYEHNYHFIGFDFESLSKDLKEVGFEEISVWDWRKTEHSYMDDYSQAYLPHMDKKNGTLMSLNIQATKK